MISPKSIIATGIPSKIEFGVMAKVIIGIRFNDGVEVQEINQNVA